MLRAGFLKGAWRRLSSVPRLISCVRGWPQLCGDSLGLRRKPYLLSTRSGARCQVRPGSSDWWIFLEIFVFGIYDRVNSDIRQATTIVDIGANVGFFAIYASTLNSTVRIHAFEPFPKNVGQMRANLSLNPNCHTHIHPLAVSDNAGLASLYFAPGDDSGCSLNAPKAQSVQVESININQVFETCGISQCDLLKMDCEGSELPILRAISSDILQAIKSMIMEYHNESDLDEISRILANAGFRCEILPKIKTLYATRS